MLGNALYTVKKVSDLVSDIVAGDGKIANLFYSVGISSPPQYVLSHCKYILHC